MSSPLESSTHDYGPMLFGFLTIVFGVVTVWSFIRGQDPLRILLLGGLTAYVFSVALGRVQQRGLRFERFAALPLGVAGVFAYAIGTPTDLPIFIILLGVGSCIDLVWDPTGTVYGNSSE